MMEEKIVQSRIVILGSGRLATQLALALAECGIAPVQIYSRQFEHALRLASQLSATCQAIDHLEALQLDADYYILSLSDAALPELIAQLPPLRGVVMHTAGSVPMDVFAGYTSSYGIFYPLQTFSLDRRVDFAEIPIYLEANNAKTLAKLQTLAAQISKYCYEADSKQRSALHLAAVFACNFVNHLYSISQSLLSQQRLPADSLAALIAETAAKAASMPAFEAQTGPAVRGDLPTMEHHAALLAEHPEWQEIYALLSRDIQRLHSAENN